MCAFLLFSGELFASFEISDARNKADATDVARSDNDEKMRSIYTHAEWNSYFSTQLFYVRDETRRCRLIVFSMKLKYIKYYAGLTSRLYAF